MSLKELTKDLHDQAENTPFMKAVFAKTLPLELWTDWTYQRSLFYGAIEGAADAAGLLDDLPGIRRSFYLYLDYKEMAGDKRHLFKSSVMEYHKYIISLYPDADKLMAHLYTWHMGDLFGGQMIKKIIDAPHRHLEFKDSKTLMTNIRTKLKDEMADEARVAFNWAIEMLNEYKV
jgi:heme oxygenase